MKAFISYARTDHGLKTKLRKYLRPIEDGFGLTIFDDQGILPGEEWEDRIWKEFDSSQLIFLIVTENFLSSDFCLRREFTRAIQRHKDKKATILPIIFRDCDWKNVKALSALQVLPDDGTPVCGGHFKPQARGFSSVIAGVRKLLVATAQRNRSSGRRARPSKPLLDNYRETPYKAVFFDLDGTLVRGKTGHEYFRYSWQLVWAHLGFPDSERKKYYNQYYETKEISYQEWCNITHDLFRERGLHESHFSEMAKKVRLTKNCKDSLLILKQRGVKLILVSGGIDTFLRAVFPDYQRFFDYVFINKFHYDAEGVLESIETTKYDFEAKFDAIEYIRKKHRLDYSQCVFVGEGRNDIFAATELHRLGGLTIGYPPEHLRDLATIDLHKDQLGSLLDILFGNAAINLKLCLGEPEA